jgi:hypothetical protein
VNFQTGDFVHCWDPSGVEELEKGKIYQISEVAKNGRISLDILDDGEWIHTYHFNKANSIVTEGTEVVIDGNSGLRGENVREADVGKRCVIFNYVCTQAFPIIVEPIDNHMSLEIKAYHSTQLDFELDESEFDKNNLYRFLDVKIDDEMLRRPLISKAESMGYRVQDDRVYEKRNNVVFDGYEKTILTGEQFESNYRYIGPVSENWNEIHSVLDEFKDNSPDIYITERRVQFRDEKVTIGNYDIFNEEIERLYDIMTIEPGFTGVTVEINGMEDVITADQLKEIYEYQIK